jgi:hypothetical protein
MHRARRIELRATLEEQMWITVADEAAISVAEYLRREATPAG